MATGQPAGDPITRYQAPVGSLALSPDGRWLAVGRHGADAGKIAGTLDLWDLNAKPPRVSQTVDQAHASAVLTLAFSPDGTQLASGSDDKSVILWDVASGSLVGRPLSGHAGPVKSVAFSPDGKYLASGGADGTVNLWNLDLSAWQAQAGLQAGRNLTQAEWTQYFGSAPYHQTCQQWPAS